MIRSKIEVTVFAFFLALLAATPVSAEEPPEEAASSRQVAFDERSDTYQARVTLGLGRASSEEEATPFVAIDLKPGWHVYWKNPGEAGLSTVIRGALTDGRGVRHELGAMSWPTPQVFKQGQGAITTFGYAERVVHALALPESTRLERGERVALKAHVNLLTCKVECIPVNVELSGEFIVPEGALEDARDRREVSLELDGASYESELSGELRAGGEDRLWRVSVPRCGAERSGSCLAGEVDVSDGELHVFLPERAEGVRLKTRSVRVTEEKVEVEIEVHPTVSTLKAALELKLAGILRARTEERGQARSVRVVERVTMDQAQGVLSPAKPQVSAEASSPWEQATAPQPGLLYALWLAFLGGLLLNAMPCVFPVLSLKVASLAQIAQHERAAMRRHGVAYTLGILTAMGALALGVLTLRYVGIEAGWGFQFQSPLFLLALMSALVVFAANLFGAFELGVPMGGAMHEALADERRTGLQRSFYEGLLCVALATPCSAPFMGTAVGFALASSGVIVAAIFLMLGLGLASPFALLSALPGWAKWLPRPGAWLHGLKIALGFSLLLTCCWLLWLMGQHQGVAAMSVSLVILVALAAASALYGAIQYGRLRWIVVGVSALALMASLWAFEALLVVEEDRDGAASTQSEAEEATGRWRAFDPEAIARDVERGEIVFVDFTADWCITCKVNEQGVLADEALLERAEALGVVWYKADWTRRDERIRRVISAHGKAGVPMYLVYGPALPAQGVVLPELLTRQIVLDGFARAR